jgi:glycosyltransferase involved in cell wall biosynthesis
MSLLDILFLEPFFGGSHKTFALELARYSRHRIEVISMPARFWKWRMRGSSLYMDRQVPDPERFDLLIAGNMLPLLELKGLWSRKAPHLPSIVYYHENQLLYPLQEGEKRDYHYGFTDISSALAADRLLFNSCTHRDAFLNALPGFITKMPDCKPVWAVEEIAGKSEIMYPGISVRPRDKGRDRLKEPPLILWNHRWEHDKMPETFFNTLFSLKQKAVPFRLAVTGERYGKVPPVFREAEQRLSRELVHFGYMEERDAYLRLLRNSDIVVSTAVQENFGLSVAEAVAAGARPLLPHRLSYPELLPREYHDRCLYRSDGELLSRLEELLKNPHTLPIPGLADSMKRFSWETLAPEYDRIFEALACGPLEAGPG